MMCKPTYAILLFTLLSFACSKDNDSVSIPDPVEDWYVVSSIDNRTWALQEPKSSQGNVSYLITGSERAIMFDTGTGENKGQDGSRMMYKVKELTDLPVTLLLSHFHFDHNQNVNEFDQIALPKLSFLFEGVNEDDVYEFSSSELFVGSRPTSISVSEWLPLNSDIDLGDRHIQLVNLPGHTDESVVIIDHEKKSVFTGDFLYSGALFAFDAGDLRTYLRSMEKFLTIIDESYTLYGAHGSPKVSYQYLLNSMSLLECIIEDDCYTESITTVFGKNATFYSSESDETYFYLVHSD
ncbi:MAG: MBL fold metallo-hydrolase [Reichenbachiella sp.]|uniref:MBL fold metallo-hydrolase n=1 Tax=Reichenbachiella sp. TaxID=2184521 RepID=UPI0029669DC5|nr:MBL fold metallo-hydrolase [Reichenbachiella sp.]MDW3211204.1 MBL fold metallo-hydrolase [Reichenbachiella sp.]